jgi:acylpyruvate hydrolase
VKLATVRTAGGTRAARVEGDELHLLGAADVGELWAADKWRERAGDADVESIPLAGQQLEPPVPRPEKIICSGLNFRSHAEELGQPIPEYPILFAKFWRALVGPTDPISLPSSSQKIDWEGELGVVIGAPVRNAGPDEARAAVAGYVAANDVSMRDWQQRSREWLQGKTFEATTPVGPVLTTLDEFDNPDDVRIRCLIDGEVMQDCSTSDMVFSVTDLISYVSQIVALVPGDLLLMGTPAGIGGKQDPPRFLGAGQELRTEVDGVGVLVNECRVERRLEGI